MASAGLPRPERYAGRIAPARLRDARTLAATGSSRLYRASVVLAGAAAFVGLAFFYYHASLHAVAPDSDHATIFLEGQSIAKGNVLLKGWVLSPDSFWSIDAVLYAFGSFLLGAQPYLFALVPGVIAALVVLVALAMVTEGRSRPAAVLGALGVLAMLMFPSHAFAFFFLQSGVHIATVLWALVAFWMLRRPGLDWRFAVAVIFLTAGMLGDLLMVAYGIVPLFLAGLLAMARQRSWRGGAVTVGAALVSVALAEAVRAVMTALGAFSFGYSRSVASGVKVGQNIAHSLGLLGQLAGIGGGVLSGGAVPAPLEDVHVLGALVLAACVLIGLIRLFNDALTGAPRLQLVRGSGFRALWHRRVSVHQSEPGAWRLDDMLVIACFGPLVSYCVLATSSSALYARYLAPTFVFATILTGRVVARLFERASSVALRRGLVVLAGGSLACFAAGTGYWLGAPVPSNTTSALVPFLEAHHLTSGVGDYWSASITTVDSKDTVRVRPVVTGPNGHIGRYARESARSWYEGQRFQFLVYDSQSIWAGVDETSAVTSWGEPSHVYELGPYRILVWPYTVTVSPGRRD